MHFQITCGFRPPTEPYAQNTGHMRKTMENISCSIILYIYDQAAN